MGHHIQCYHHFHCKGFTVYLFTLDIHSTQCDNYRAILLALIIKPLPSSVLLTDDVLNQRQECVDIS